MRCLFVVKLLNLEKLQFWRQKHLWVHLILVHSLTLVRAPQPILLFGSLFQLQIAFLLKTGELKCYRNSCLNIQVFRCEQSQTLPYSVTLNFLPKSDLFTYFYNLSLRQCLSLLSVSYELFVLLSHVKHSKLEEKI